MHAMLHESSSSLHASQCCCCCCCNCEVHDSCFISTANSHGCCSSVEDSVPPMWNKNSCLYKHRRRRRHEQSSSASLSSMSKLQSQYSRNTGTSPSLSFIPVATSASSLFSSRRTSSSSSSCYSSSHPNHQLAIKDYLTSQWISSFHLSDVLISRTCRWYHRWCICFLTCMALLTATTAASTATTTTTTTDALQALSPSRGSFRWLQSSSSSAKGQLVVQRACPKEFVTVQTVFLTCDSPAAYYYGSDTYRQSPVCMSSDRANLQVGCKSLYYCRLLICDKC
jgi:hypothetical protein